MGKPFEDIRIVGLDDSLTSRPIPERTQFYDLHFTLSADAPTAWVQIANNHLASPFGTCGRRVRATGGHLVASCSLGEMQAILDALKPIVAAVNEEYRKWSAGEERIRRESEALEQREAEKRQELKSKLRFD